MGKTVPWLDKRVKDLTRDYEWQRKELAKKGIGYIGEWTNDGQCDKQRNLFGMHQHSITKKFLVVSVQYSCWNEGSFRVICCIRANATHIGKQNDLLMGTISEANEGLG